MRRYLLTPTILEQMKCMVHEETKMAAGLEQGEMCGHLLTPIILEQMKSMVHEVTKVACGLEQCECVGNF
jgi:hypothetical protein